ncbi:MAG: hypothetical protein ACK5PS_02485 [Desulfopila sp.]
MNCFVFRRKMCFLALVVLMSVLQGCAHDRVTASWVDRTFVGPVKGQILVIGAFTDPTAHKIYENSFVDVLRKAGAEATASSAVKVGAQRHSKAWLAQLRMESGAEYILITHLRKMKARDEDYGAVGNIWGGGLMVDDADGVDSYHTFVVKSTVIPEETVTTTTDYLVATLFDSRTGKAIWSAHSKDVDLNNYLKKEDESVEEGFIRSMQKDHIL